MKRSIDVPRAVQGEIAELARRTGRSTGFLVRRALAAAPDAPPVAFGETAPLALALDEDDDPKTLSRIAGLCGSRDPGAAVAAAWSASRERFLAWAARHEAAERAADGDDLDRALAAAASSTDPGALAALARSEYVQVRARVAANPNTPADVRSLLARDGDRVVRERALR